MPTTQPVVVALPENVQEAVNLAHSRMTAMKEQEEEARRSKTKLDKDVGRLILEKETLEGFTKTAQGEYKRIKASVDTIQKELEEAQKKLVEAQNQALEAQNQAIKEKQAAETQERVRNELIADCSARTEAIVARETKVKSDEEALEKRKQDLIEAIRAV